MEIHIGGRTAEVALISKEGNKVQVSIDGKPYDVDIVMAENGRCSILHGGNSYNAELTNDETGKQYDVNMFYRSFHVEIVNSQAKYLRMRNKNEERQDDYIAAPMPGKGVKVCGQPGDKLESGDTAVVLEAMKMQSNFKVSASCRVKEVLVVEGDSVSTDQVLVKLDLI